MKTKIIDFSKYSSIKVGGFRTLNIIENKSDISVLKDFKIIGGGNNLLLSNNKNYSLAMLSKNFDFIKRNDSIIEIGGATLNGKIFNFCKKENIGGFEFIQNIPSTLGGMIKMNAGLKGFEIFNNLISIQTERGEILKENIKYDYRYTDISNIILSAKFSFTNHFSEELVLFFQNLRKNQPKGNSAGSTFKNPKFDSAGKLIEAVGLKGFKIGNMLFSEIHSNFLINSGGGKFDDAIKLIKLAESRVFDKFGISLNREISII